MVAAKEMGFKAAKRKVRIEGLYSRNGIQIDDDREIALSVKECRSAVGDGTTLMVDVAYFWPDWRAAQRAILMFEDCDINFIETPLPNEEIEGDAKLVNSTSVPVAAGGWLNTRFEFREYMRMNTFDVVQPDVGRAGGLTEARRVASEAQDKGLSVVSPTCHFIEYLPVDSAHSRLRRELVVDDYQIVTGQFEIPERPVLGVTFNEKTLLEFRVGL